MKGHLSQINGQTRNAAHFDNRDWMNLCLHFVGNKAQWRISKWALQENKARRIFRKNENFLPPC